MASEKNGILSADEKNELIQLTSKALNDYLQITPNANFEDQNFLNLYNKAMSAKFISGLKAQQSPAHPKTPRVQVETISHPQQPPAGATPKPETSRLQRRRPAAAKSPAGATTGELALGTLIVRPAN